MLGQKISIDSSQRFLDLSGDFNGVSFLNNYVKKRAEFPGGKTNWQNFLRNNINIKIPISNNAKPDTYVVVIRFIVDDHGKMHAIGADSNCGYGMETEIIRCVKKSSDWIPAETESGKKVASTVRTAVIFTVKRSDVTISFM